jgi:L-asparaginase II
VSLAVLAHIVRNGFVEGVHHGSAIALDPTGEPRLSLGEPGVPVLPRSSLKPLQAVAMLRAGLRLEGPLLALAAASHGGEAYHRDGVSRVLEAAGLSTAALRNIPDLPLGAAERLVWQRLGRAPERIAMNCSGKHAAMLATCVRNGWDVDTYLAPEHPLQRATVDVIEDLTGEPVAATTVDGCGAPAFAVSLTGLARAFARIARGGPATPEGQVAAAIRVHPEWLGGTDREVTELLRAVPGLIAKDGAEGVYAAALPDGRAVAFKIADGTERARPVVMAALLRALGVESPVLEASSRRPLLGGGTEVGSVLFSAPGDLSR